MILPVELKAILTTIRLVGTPKTVLEIGCYEGHTSNACLKEFPSIEKYYGLDVNPEYKAGLKVQERQRAGVPGKHALHDQRFKLILLPRGSFDLDVFTVGRPDVIFIDGDHSAKAVRHDTDLARSIVQPGGVIMWHDYGNPHGEVTGVLDADVEKGHPIRYVDKTWLAYEQIDK